MLLQVGVALALLLACSLQTSVTKPRQCGLWQQLSVCRVCHPKELQFVDYRHAVQESLSAASPTQTQHASNTDSKANVTLLHCILLTNISNTLM